MRRARSDSRPEGQAGRRSRNPADALAPLAAPAPRSKRSASRRVLTRSRRHSTSRRAWTTVDSRTPLPPAHPGLCLCHPRSSKPLCGRRARRSTRTGLARPRGAMRNGRSRPLGGQGSGGRGSAEFEDELGHRKLRATIHHSGSWRRPASGVRRPWSAKKRHTNALAAQRGQRMPASERNRRGGPQGVRTPDLRRASVDTIVLV